MTAFVLIVLIVILFLYTLYWKGMDLSHIYNNRTIYFGHRGLRYKAPENTVKSYKKAIDAGFNSLELDVRITKDLKLICSHNIDLERETFGGGYVDELTYKELSKLKSGRGFTKDEQTKIPLLQEVMDKLPNDILLNIEIKSDSLLDLTAARELVKIIKADGIKQPIIISSFNPLMVRYIKYKTKDIPIGYIYEIAKDFKGVFLARPDCLHPEAELIDADLIDFCHKRNISINAWTVNNRYAKEWLVKKGIKGIITDNPKIQS